MSRLPARQWIASVMVFCTLLLSILACGGMAPPEMIPVATLEPNFPLVRVVSLVDNTLQSHAARDGAIQWSTHLTSLRNTLLTSSADSHIVYVSIDQSPMVSAVDASTGRILWRFTTCARPDDRVLQSQDMLFVTCGQSGVTGPDDISLATVYALEAHTGFVLWKRPQQHAQAIAGEHLVVQTTTGVAALNAKTGKTIWEHQVDFTPPSFELNGLDHFRFVVVVGPAGMYYSPDGIHAEVLRASDGTLLWHTGKLQDTPSAPNDTYVQHTVVAVATANVVVTKGRFGVTALRPRDGKMLWNYYRYPNGGGISIAVDKDGTVYTSDYVSPSISKPMDGDFYALAALNSGDGTVRWRVPGSGQNLPTLVINEDTLLITGLGLESVSALRTEDGTTRWQWPYVLGVQDVVTASSFVVLQSYSALYLLKLSDGLKVWKQELPNSRQAAPLVLTA